MKQLTITLRIFLFLTILTGIAYPLAITGIVQLAFPARANGSLVVRNDTLRGSILIGQAFQDPRYFSSRPSSTGYRTLPSGGSNLGPTSARLKEQSERFRKDFIRANGLDSLASVPAEMIFESASGLDPDISPEAARLQVDRVARARNFTEKQKELLINKISDLELHAPLLFPGRDRINVLLLNLYADQIQ